MTLSKRDWVRVVLDPDRVTTRFHVLGLEYFTYAACCDDPTPEANSSEAYSLEVYCASCDATWLHVESAGSLDDSEYRDERQAEYDQQNPAPFDVQQVER